MPNDKDEIRRKARIGLGNTASYENEKHKLSSLGRRPEVDEYKKAYVKWLFDAIEDNEQITNLIIRYGTTVSRAVYPKPTKRQILDFITSEKKRIMEDPTIIKKKK